jgi:hypothetical protein
MCLWRESPPQSSLVTVLSSKDGCLLQLGIFVSQVGLYPMSALAWACFFVVMPISDF